MKLHEIQEAMQTDMDKPLNAWEKISLAADGLHDSVELTPDDLQWICSAFRAMAEELEIERL